MNNKICNSLSKMPVWQVIAMAKECIALIQKTRDEDYEKKIVDLMKEDQRGLMETLFRKPQRFLSREEADQLLRSIDPESYSPFSEYQWSQMKYESHELQIKRILNWADLAHDDNVYMTVDDLWLITK